MDCDRARSVIVLRESGDATPRQRRALERHVGQCGECARFAANLRPLPLHRFRAEPPLGDADFAEIRRAVLARVGSGRQRIGWRPLVAFAVAGAAAVALVIVGVFGGQHAPATPPERIAVGAPPSSPVVSPPVSEPVPSAPARIASTPAPQGIGSASGPRRPRHLPAAPALPVLSTPGSTPETALAALAPAAAVRIEFQTSDPNVRIIWIAQPPPMNPSSVAKQAAPDEG